MAYTQVALETKCDIRRHTESALYVRPEVSPFRPCQVIFDGYSTSIKDHEHTRCSEGKTHCNVLVQLDTVNKYDRD